MPITLCGLWPLSSWTLTGVRALEEILPNATFSMTVLGSAVQRWANPVSLAVTKGITVVFFSSAY